jgi:ABC-type sugar transport system permease subunit
VQSDGRCRAQSRSVSFYRTGIAVFAVVFIGLGIALLVVTAVRGGAAFGYLMGVLFVALGVGRLYLLRPRR